MAEVRGGEPAGGEDVVGHHHEADGGDTEAPEGHGGHMGVALGENVHHCAAEEVAGGGDRQGGDAQSSDADAKEPLEPGGIALAQV